MRRHFRDMLTLGLPFVLVVLLAGAGAYWLHGGTFIIAGIVIGAPIAIVGLVRQIRHFLHFPCPTCGTMLQRSGSDKAGAPITFLCTPCDTEWDTGFTEGSD